MGGGRAPSPRPARRVKRAPRHLCDVCGKVRDAAPPEVEALEALKVCSWCRKRAENRKKGPAVVLMTRPAHMQYVGRGRSRWVPERID